MVSVNASDVLEMFSLAVIPKGTCVDIKCDQCRRGFLYADCVPMDCIGVSIRALLIE